MAHISLERSNLTDGGTIYGRRLTISCNATGTGVITLFQRWAANRESALLVLPPLEFARSYLRSFGDSPSMQCDSRFPSCCRYPIMRISSKLALTQCTPPAGQLISMIPVDQIVSLSSNAHIPGILSTFNASIGGKLHNERPTGAPCYPTDPAYDPAACDTITKNYQDDQWREDLFGNFEQINWETCTSSDACLVPPNSNTSTCGQGSVPSYSVHATSSEEVVKYVKFATTHNLRMVIKNTGHDYLGRSSGKGGFALWTHGMQGISRNEAFVPAGCPVKSQNVSTASPYDATTFTSQEAFSISVSPQDAVTIAAGAQWSTVYQYAEDNNIIIVGGDSKNVGAAGGWIQGGGHSVLSPAYGLGVDNLLQTTIVTADGVERTINQCQDPISFGKSEAIRGGGPGTWGILTSVTYKARPAVPFAWVSISSSSATVDDNYSIVQKYIEHAPVWSDLGGGSFINIFPKAVAFLGVVPNVTSVQAKQSFANVEAALPPDSSISYFDAPSFLSFFKETFAINNEIVGINFLLASRLIPRTYFETDAAGLASAIRKGQTFLGASADVQQIQILADSPAPKFQDNMTSVTPAWYDSLWHVIYTTAWENNATIEEQQELVKGIHDGAQVLRDYVPESGAYLNEADVFEPNYEVSFWSAANAARLKEIKAKYDPRNVFQVWKGIGWDGATDPKFECYSRLSPGGASSVN
ncbi:hypothetical protein B0F90DRAFT_1669171 [Multifurca ochricompacta]|uniref:FAD-binding PCMH-type domain-containing protein n=1 Tax=Multifurca ochricompacta TaxID=376703 RepID=A0AAD4M1Q7_9AGAM|nr:hypothetical protein B0F90DRAFT_1669171 [Multifurca ochricompacta]